MPVPPSASGRGYDALLVDDDADLMDVLAEALGSFQGWSCLTINSFQALLERSEEALSTRVAVLDFNLGYGKPNGMAALHWLRSQNYQRRIVLMTGYSDTYPSVAAARQMERTVVLRKPIDLDTLFEAVASHSP